MEMDVRRQIDKDRNRGGEWWSGRDRVIRGRAKTGKTETVTERDEGERKGGEKLRLMEGTQTERYKWKRLFRKREEEMKRKDRVTEEKWETRRNFS